MTKEDFRPSPGTVNGANPDDVARAAMIDILPGGADWKPKPETQARLREAHPWITAEIAKARFLQFLNWTPRRPTRNFDAAWLDFMSRTRREDYPETTPGGTPKAFNL